MPGHLLPILHGILHWVSRPVELLALSLLMLVSVTGLLLYERNARKTVMHGLEVEEKRYRDLFENATDAIYEHDLKGNFLALNRAGETLCGYDRREILGMNFAQLVHPDDWRQVREYMKTRKGRRLGLLELRLIHRDGHIVHAETTARMIRSVSGDLVIQGVARDVTERRLLEDGRVVLLRVARVLDGATGMRYIFPQVLRMIAEWRGWDCVGFWYRSPGRDPIVPFCWPATEMDTMLQYPPKWGSSDAVVWTLQPGSAFATVVSVRMWEDDGHVGYLVLLAHEAHSRQSSHLAFLRDVGQQLAQFRQRLKDREELRGSEERFRSAFLNSTIGMALISTEGKIQQANPALCRMLGYTGEEMKTLDVAALTHPDDLEAEQRLMTQLLAGESDTCEVEKRYLHKNGHVVWAQLGMSLQRNAELRPVNFIAQVLDQSDRKRNEQDLQRSERRYRSLFERNLAGVVRSTREGRILDCNDAFARLLGFRYREEVLHQSVLDYYENMEAREETIRLLLADGSVVNHEVRLKRENGDRIWVLASLSLMAEEDGREPLIEGTMVDITERKRAEQELARLTRRMQLILNSAGEGICGVDQEGRIIFANPAAAGMTGWQVEELLGQQMHEIWHHSHADGKPYPAEECPIFASFEDGESRHISDEVFWRRDGSSFPVEYVSTPIRSDVRDTIGAVILFQDISERRAVERMKDEFVSVVSHELRTPLTAVRGSLGLLSSGRLGAMPDKARQMLEIGVSNTDRLIRLINDILDVERLNSGKIALQLEVREVEPMVSRAVAAMSPLADRQGIRLEVNCCLAYVRADSDRVEQTLTNLLGNAVKFSMRDTVIQVNARIDGEEVVFSVIDQGKGIPENKLHVIFERFQQVDASDSREKGGTGLGLAICRSIVQQHGGRIWVESRLGQGSTFSFTLPRVEAETPPELARAASNSA